MNKTLKKTKVQRTPTLNLEQFADRTAKQMKQCITYFEGDDIADFRMNTIYKVCDIVDNTVLLEHKDEKFIVPTELLMEDNQQLLKRRLLIKVREKNRRYCCEIKCIYEDADSGMSMASEVNEDCWFDLELRYLLFAIDCKISPQHINNEGSALLQRSGM